MLLYTAAEASRESSFNTSQGNRTTQFMAAQDARTVEFNADQTARDTAFDGKITGFENQVDAVTDALSATVAAQFQYKFIGSFAAHTGDVVVTAANKLNAYSTGTAPNVQWWGIVQSSTFPITVPADPTADPKWVALAQINPYANAMPSSTFNANREMNKDKFAGSGFVEWGKHIAMASAIAISHVIKGFMQYTHLQCNRL